jgi:hypothetical protein
MKFLGTLFCKILTRLFYRGEKRSKELKKCLACLEVKKAEKTPEFYRRKKPKMPQKSKNNLGFKK